MWELVYNLLRPLLDFYRFLFIVYFDMCSNCNKSVIFYVLIVKSKKLDKTILGLDSLYLIFKN